MKSDNVSVLLPYQKRWIEDDSAQKISEKSRRIGISYTEALNSVLKAAPQSGAVNTYYLSYNKDMTRQFISDCADWARRLEIACADICAEEILDGDRAVMAFRLRFASGAEIAALPSEPYVLRSKKGRVVFDEAAFCTKFDEVLKAAQALLIWGGQLSIISTHNGEDNPFALLVQDVRQGRRPEWSLHRTTFREAVDAGLYRRICLVNGERWSQKAQDVWIDKIYTIYKDNALEELDVIPVSGNAKYFGRGLLRSCVRDTGGVFRWEFDNDFLHQSAQAKERRIASLARSCEPYIAWAKGKLYFGMDFGRSGDLSVIWTACQTGVTVQTLLVIEIQNCPFREQEQAVRLLLESAQRRGVLGGIAIDARGNGQALAENISVDFPGAAAGVMETAAWYAEWFARLKAFFETEDFTLPDDETVLADFGIVTVKNGNPYIPDVRTADRTGRGRRHGDAAAAAVLACYALHECAASPPPVFSAAPVKKRRGFFGLF